MATVHNFLMLPFSYWAGKSKWWAGFGLPPKHYPRCFVSELFPSSGPSDLWIHSCPTEPYILLELSQPCLMEYFCLLRYHFPEQQLLSCACSSSLPKRLGMTLPKPPVIGKGWESLWSWPSRTGKLRYWERHKGWLCSWSTGLWKWPIFAGTASRNPGRVDSALHPSEVDKMSTTQLAVWEIWGTWPQKVDPLGMGYWDASKGMLGFWVRSLKCCFLMGVSKCWGKCWFIRMAMKDFIM